MEIFSLLSHLKAKLPKDSQLQGPEFQGNELALAGFDFQRRKKKKYFLNNRNKLKLTNNPRNSKQC